MVTFIKDWGVRALGIVEAWAETLKERFAKVGAGVAGRVRDATKTETTEKHKRASRMLEHGRKHYNKKRYGKARRYFLGAVSSDPEYALAHYYLGLVRYQLNFSDRALASWEQAIRVDPDSDAALKAKQNIERVSSVTVRVIDELQQQLKRK